MARISKQGAVLYKLRRTAKERWHLYRTMITQLATHERIRSTLTKCQAIKPLAEKMMQYARQISLTNDERARRNLQGILTTKFAREKVVKEIAPRFKDRNFHFIRVVNLKTNRRGDAAPVGYVEIIYNDLDKYEKALKLEKIDKGEVPDLEKYSNKILKQERDFFKQQLEKCQENYKFKCMENEEVFLRGEIDQKEVIKRNKLNKVQIDFFTDKLRRVEHDLYITNKNKYDLIKYPVQFN